MKQAANLELGKKFWMYDNRGAHVNEQRKYIELVKALSSSNKSLDQICAFYLIKHSIPQNHNQVYRIIDRRLLVYLTDISKTTSAEVKAEVDKRYNMDFICKNMIENNKVRNFRK